MLGTEPVWRHEVSDTNSVDLVSVVTIFHGIAHLACPEGALHVLAGAVEPRVHCHLANLMSRADTHAGLICQDCLDEDQGNWQAFIRQVVVRKRIGLSGVIQKNDPPTARRRCDTLVDKGELCLAYPPGVVQFVIPL